MKVYAEAEKAGQAGSEGPAAPARPAPKPASGRDYLLQRRRQSRANEDMWSRAEEFATKLHATLSDRADDARLHAPQNPRLSGAAGRNVLNAAYLVGRDASEEFVEMVDRTKDDVPGMRVELTGPWAA
ncbi:GvpL/GvpF family gas vesicle protein OS=Streptomyces tendae OX=1932 GN=GUR47_01340 PE=3 SV=1 [Streptomyces tendae]